MEVAQGEHIDQREERSQDGLVGRVDCAGEEHQGEGRWENQELLGSGDRESFGTDGWSAVASAAERNSQGTGFRHAGAAMGQQESRPGMGAEGIVQQKFEGSVS